MHFTVTPIFHYYYYTVLLFIKLSVLINVYILITRRIRRPKTLSSSEINPGCNLRSTYSYNALPHIFCVFLINALQTYKILYTVTRDSTESNKSESSNFGFINPRKILSNRRICNYTGRRTRVISYFHQ